MKGTKTPKTKRGGSRPGAGRIPFYGMSLDKHTIRIAPQHTELFRRIDPTAKNPSKPIRDLLDDPEIQIAIEKFIEKRNRAHATKFVFLNPE